MNRIKMSASSAAVFCLGLLLVAGATVPLHAQDAAALKPDYDKVTNAQQAMPEPPATKDTSGTSSPKAVAGEPVPDANGIYKVGGKVKSPEVMYSVTPDYTGEARKQKITGTCRVSLTVDKNGNPQEVFISKSMADGVKAKLRAAAIEYDEQAVAAVKQYRFKPATLNGRAVPVKIAVQITFRID